jgi:acyl-CoA synthetase (AMP-forming)/AMP-acid ligase II
MADGNCRGLLADYVPAFAEPGSPFLTYHGFTEGGSTYRRDFTRGEFWTLAAKGAHVLRGHGLGAGDCFAHWFSANRVEDLAFRLAATMVGAVPVTVNWQADTQERIAYKIGLTECRLVLVDAGVPAEFISAVAAEFPGMTFFPIEDLAAQPELLPDEFCAEGDRDATRIIIFTSGTTGQPKGVCLPYRSYETNRATFESFLRIGPGDLFAPLVVNPLHHTNSTAITDWALRRPGTRLHLVERYSTQYWSVIAAVAREGYDRIVAPAVSRHFDYLENLRQAGRLPVPLDELRTAMERVDFLIGSAPVGPTTVRRLQDYTGRMPLVRFGSTETCLQVMGTPYEMPGEQRLRAFERGWAHARGGEPQSGYYIGRPHPPHTEVRVVRAADPGDDGYFVDCAEGEPGRFITRGGNVMQGYVKDADATRRVLDDDGWYSGLGDVGFWLANEGDGRRDYYWMSRESALLIRGGANYACAQVGAELAAFVTDRYGLPADSVDLAVVGLLVESEHEDECCVTIELVSPQAQGKRLEIERTFLEAAARAVSKGARPDRLRFGRIPRNFKGAILMQDLKADYRAAIEGAATIISPSRRRPSR